MEIYGYADDSDGNYDGEWDGSLVFFCHPEFSSGSSFIFQTPFSILLVPKVSKALGEEKPRSLRSSVSLFLIWLKQFLPPNPAEFTLFDKKKSETDTKNSPNKKQHRNRYS
jgi:hypothetical protein